MFRKPIFVPVRHILFSQIPYSASKESLSSAEAGQKLLFGGWAGRGIAKKKMVTLGKRGYSSKNASHWEKWITYGKMGHT